MKKLVARFCFTFIQILCIPISVVGYTFFIPRLMRATFKAGASLTAFGPLFGRWMQNELKQRPDPVAGQVFLALPGVSKKPLYWVLLPIRWGYALTGYLPPNIRYPVRTQVDIQSLISVRTEFFDDILTSHIPELKQVVILGAGYDTRAYHQMPAKFFEVDIHDTQKSKLEALKKADIDTRDVVYVCVDFEQNNWFHTLVEHGFNPQEPALFLWEGVTYYLSESAVRNTLETLATQAAPQSLILFDYFSTDFVGGVGWFYGFLKWRFAKLKEPLLFGIKTQDPAEEHVASFLNECGLSLLQYATYSPYQPLSKPSYGGLAAAKVEAMSDASTDVS